MNEVVTFTDRGTIVQLDGTETDLNGVPVKAEAKPEPKPEAKPADRPADKPNPKPAKSATK